MTTTESNSTPPEPPLSWEVLVAKEPALGQLLEWAQSVRRHGKLFCRDLVWTDGYDGMHPLRDRINALVGWKAKNADPLLATEAAWDVVCAKLLSALPQCRSCGCVDENLQFID